MVKNPTANAGDSCVIPLVKKKELADGEGNGNPLQCSCLGNPRTGEPGGLRSMGSQRVGHD